MALVNQFLTSLRGFLQEQNGDKLRDWLQVEQNASAEYYALGREIRASFPGGGNSELDAVVDRRLVIPDEGSVPESQGAPWPGFVAFVKEYLQYWRDADFDDLLRLYEALSGLLT